VFYLLCRERIRAQLAQQQREEREGKSLQLCFLNEAVFDNENDHEDDDDDDDQDEEDDRGVEKEPGDPEDLARRPSAVFIARWKNYARSYMYNNIY